MSDVALPRTPDDVTPSWLSRALHADFSDVVVEAIDWEQLHDGTAVTSRLRVAYAPGETTGPDTVCLKAGFDGAHREFIFRSGLFAKEAMVYRELLPRAAARVPRCFSAEYDAAEGRGYTLLEDLGLRDATFCGAEEPLSVDEAASGLDQLAALHAAAWNDAEIDEPRWRHRGRSLDEDDPLESHMLSMIPAASRRPHAQAVTNTFHDPDVIGPAIARLRALDHRSAVCLIHGDAHIGNFYRDPSGEIGMADFQCVQRGHYSHDVAMFVASSLDVRDRRAHERDLVALHLEGLAQRGVAATSFEDAWLGYRRHVLYGLWAWMLTTPQFQQEERLVACVFRFGTATVDLDALEAIATP